MRDRSNEPRTIIMAGAAMIVLALAVAPVVWWLGSGVQAGQKDEARFESSQRAHSEVALYTFGLRAVGLVLGIAEVALAATGCVIVWKGARRVRS